MNSINNLIKTINKNGGCRMYGKYTVKVDNGNTLTDSLRGKDFVIWNYDGGISFESVNRPDKSVYHSLTILQNFLTKGSVVSYRVNPQFNGRFDGEYWKEIYLTTADGETYQAWLNMKTSGNALDRLTKESVSL